MIVPTRRHLFCPINETKGSFFLTTGGAPYDCRWKAVTTEPFETMSVFIELPLLQRAFEEVFGDRAPHLRLRDVSAFTDPTLNSLMEQVKSELMRRDASPLLLGGIDQHISELDLLLERTLLDDRPLEKLSPPDG